MPTIKLYSEVTINEKEAQQSFFGKSGKSALQSILSVFFFNKNYHIEKRIERIRSQSASAKQWNEMNDQEHVSHIYRSMAEEKAIQRMLRLKD